MNNQRNNRRRGRGNRNQGGNPNAMNRIDSRARGNAPQLLDKYKKLAQDAHHNGDRVQQEYYLQFADHYFRVIADNKARQDEQRAKRDADRGNDRGQANDDGDDGDDDRRQRRGRKNRDDEQGEDNRKPRRKRGDDDDARDDSDERPAKKPAARTRKPKRDDAEGERAVEGEIDAAVLPPAISAEDEAPKPRRRSPRKKPDDDDSGTLSAVG